MPSIVVDGTTYELPADDSVAQKVPSYNAALSALATILGSAGAAWVAWTPTWTNLTVGNGTATAKYARVGKIVFARLIFVFGSTSAISGVVQVSLPVTRATNVGVAGINPQGLVSLYDLSADVVYGGALGNFSTTTGIVRVFNASGTYLTQSNLSSTVPFTWATGDEIHAEFFYEAA